MSSVDDLGERSASRAAAAAMTAPSDALAAALVGRALARGPAATGGEPAPTSAREALGRALEAPGEPLEAAERARFEARLGADLGEVRLHRGAAADAAADALGARALAVGGDVVLPHRPLPL